MNLTKTQLRRIIQEELENLEEDEGRPYDDPGKLAHWWARSKRGKNVAPVVIKPHPQTPTDRVDFSDEEDSTISGSNKWTKIFQQLNFSGPGEFGFEAIKRGWFTPEFLAILQKY